MRIRTAVILAAALLLTVPTVHADGPVQKLGRGVANVVTSPFEVFKGMGEAKQEDGIFAGFTWGLLKGTVDTVKRCAVGVYEVATFPIPLPADYDPILEDPEYFLKDSEYSGAIEKDWSYE